MLFQTATSVHGGVFQVNVDIFLHSSVLKMNIGIQGCSLCLMYCVEVNQALSPRPRRAIHTILSWLLSDRRVPDVAATRHWAAAPVVKDEALQIKCNLIPLRCTQNPRRATKNQLFIVYHHLFSDKEVGILWRAWESQLELLFRHRNGFRGFRGRY